MVELTPRAAKKTKQVVTDYLSHGSGERSPDTPRRAGPIFFDGKLTSDLEAGGLDTPVTATFEFWDIDPDSDETPKPCRASSRSDTLVNRSVSLTGEIGTAIIVVRMKNEWRIIWADC